MNTTQPLRWWQETIAYEVYPRSFQDSGAKGTGDLRGITRRLDYLASLGVGALWLTPVYPSPMVDNGYDITDYCAIDPRFGTMEDMDRLIARARDYGIRIVMDLVFNHTSDRHPWFLDSAQNGRRRDWYIWRDPKPDGTPPTNWRSIFGGPAWTWCASRKQFYLHTFASAQPDLNWENPAVRRALFDAAGFWADKGVGGFRIDAIPYVKKPPVFADGVPDGQDGLVSVHTMTVNTPGILDFLLEFRNSITRDLFTVAETVGVPLEELPRWTGENGPFDMLFLFDHMNLEFPTVENWCYPRRWTLRELKAALTAAQEATARSGWYPIFFENHDRLRAVNHFFPPEADGDLAAKAMLTLLLTLRGTPFLYQGQELGYRNVAWEIDAYDDLSTRAQYQFALSEGFSPREALRAAQTFSRDNARTPMQWDASPNGGFTAGTPWLPVHEDYPVQNVAAESENPASPLSWCRRLSALRQSEPVLRRGSYREIYPESEQIYGFLREDGAARAAVLVNFTGESVPIAEGGDRALSSCGTFLPGTLRPWESVVLLSQA